MIIVKKANKIVNEPGCSGRAGGRGPNPGASPSARPGGDARPRCDSSRAEAPPSSLAIRSPRRIFVASGRFHLSLWKEEASRYLAHESVRHRDRPRRCRHSSGRLAGSATPLQLIFVEHWQYESQKRWSRGRKEERYSRVGQYRTNRLQVPVALKRFHGVVQSVEDSHSFFQRNRVHLPGLIFQLGTIKRAIMHY